MIRIIFTAVNAIAPIILLILLGYVLKRIKFLPESFIKTGNKLVFKVLLPAMLFMNIYDSDWSAFRWELILYSVILILVIFCLGFVTAVLTTKRADRRGVILQCAFRSNFAIIGTSLAASLAGGTVESGATVALLQAFSIPLFNILGVISLSVFVGKFPRKEERVSVQTSLPPQGACKHGILREIVSNPLIIAVAAGLVFCGLRQLEIAACGEVVFSVKNQLPFVYNVLNQLKNIASPFALIILGGQFEFSAAKGMFKEIAVGTVWRIVAAPLLGLGIAALLSKTGILPLGIAEFPALVALFGSPVAVSSAIMAAEMKNDEQLAAQLVVWTSVFSVLTIFISVCILMAAGLLAV